MPGPPDPIERALARQAEGDLAGAEALYREVLAQDPDEPDALNLLGLVLQQRGDLAGSVALLRRALAADPAFPEALANLARAQFAMGELEAAAASAARAEELDPEMAEAPLVLCRALLGLGRAAEAAQAGHRAAALAPESAEAHEALGNALEMLADWAGAAAAYRVAFGREPHRVTLRVRLAGVLMMQGAAAEAAEHFRLARDAAPDELPPLVGLAAALERADDTLGSLAACERALALAPERADMWLLRAHNLQALGRFDEAKASYDRVLALEPATPDALRQLALINRLEPGDARTARLEAALAAPETPAEARILAGFTLGTLLDRAGAYDEAFARFAAANRLSRELLAARGEVFDAAALEREVSPWFEQFTPRERIRAAGKGDPSELPVFVVGMPRTGTTLVEQIAASHSRVHGAGESKAIIEMVRRLHARHPDTHPVDWGTAAIRAETEPYLASLRRQGGGAARVIEKLPDNLFYAGYISILFPRARIVLCRRDLRDVCLSCYFQHFVDANTWSLDLADCAARARVAERLARLWPLVLPRPPLELRYEALVRDPEAQSRRLIAFLGLEWEPACLEFHRTERPVGTLSQWQVRQPIYSTSVGRWRHYRRHIRPMLDALADLVPPEDTPGAA